MLRNVFLKTLRDHRRGLIGWSIGLVTFTAFTVAFYPAFRDSAPDLTKLFRDLPESLLAVLGGEIDFSGPGYLHARFFAFLAPLLLMVFAIGYGARTIAGEEQDGVLELVLATPVTRRQIVAQKLGAMLISAALLGAVTAAALVATSTAVDIGVSAGSLVGATASAVLLALVFGTLALFLGCWLGRRVVASAATSAIAAATYLVDAFAGLVEPLEPLRYLSPWAAYDPRAILAGGAEPGGLLVLAGLILAFSAGAILSFDRRDVGIATA